MSERSAIFRKTLSALKEIWSLLPAVCSACNMHFFGHQVLILFWTHLPCFFSILSVCMPGLFCSAAFWLVRIAYCWRLGGAEKNRAIKRFRNCAISNRDFISISINRTALIESYSKKKYSANIQYTYFQDSPLTCTWPMVFHSRAQWWWFMYRPLMVQNKQKNSIALKPPG